MAVRQYIGARYVTKIYENSVDPSIAEWEASVNYEPLTMVTYNNGSYLSKKDVPASVGNPAANPTYWAQTGFYNGQIAALDNRIGGVETQVENLETDIGGYDIIGILRPTADGWVVLDGGNHKSKNFGNVIVSADGSTLTVDTITADTIVGTFLVTPDERFSVYGMQIGAAVNNHFVSISGVWNYDFYGRIKGNYTNLTLYGNDNRSVGVPSLNAGGNEIIVPYTAIAQIIKPEIAMVTVNAEGNYFIRPTGAFDTNDSSIHFKIFGSSGSAVSNPSLDVDFSFHSHTTREINWNDIISNYGSWMDSAAIFVYGKNLSE